MFKYCLICGAWKVWRKYIELKINNNFIKISEVRSVSAIPNTKYILTGGLDNYARVFDY